ncbi:hypothetical protein KAU86_05070 [bacterium]|nr:hypothetical protein [bacterium]
MANQKQIPLAVAGLIVIIVVALFFVIKQAMPKRYRPPKVDWTCEACGHQFIAPSVTSPTECPKCGKKEAVRSTYYECEKCGTVFEVYRSKMPPLPASTEGSEDIPPEMMMEMEGLIKKPDGEWVKEMSEEGRKITSELACPECGNNDRKALKYSPPTKK